ncbi:MAG: metallophosphoesterase family protein [Gammaproteobacteria bacterium]
MTNDKTRIVRGDKMLVFGGVCGNLQALHALFRAAERANIPPSNWVCTGDMVAYCAGGDEVCGTVRRAMSKGIIVRGNCERSLAENNDDCGCGFAEGGVCDTLSASWFAHAKKTISPQHKRWFASLPEQVRLSFGGRVLTVLHAAADADNQFIFASTPARQKAQQIAQCQTDGMIAGHSGIPFSQLTGGGLWHNSGALGMPANDGTARVWFSVFRRLQGGIRITHRPLRYAKLGARRAMQKAKMPPHYQKTLTNGLWPSDDILPPPEKAQQGIALHPPALFWRD